MISLESCVIRSQRGPGSCNISLAAFVDAAAELAIAKEFAAAAELANAKDSAVAEELAAGRASIDTAAEELVVASC